MMDQTQLLLFLWYSMAHVGTISLAISIFLTIAFKNYNYFYIILRNSLFLNNFCNCLALVVPVSSTH